MNAQAELDEIQRQVAALQAQAKAVSSAAGAERTAKEHRVSDLEERARLNSHAGQLRDQAEEAGQRAAELDAERERLEQKIEGFDGRLAELQAEGQQVAAELAAARDAADLDAMTSLRNRADSIADLVLTFDGLREAAQHRAGQVGDGTASVPGELSDAREAGSVARGALREALNRLDPERPEARHDAVMEEVLGAIEGNRARLEAERKAAGQPRRTVML